MKIRTFIFSMLLLSISSVALGDVCGIIQNSTVPRGVNVTLNGKKIRNFKAPLSGLDADLEYYASSIFGSNNPLLRSLDLINQLKSEGRCETRPVKCTIDSLGDTSGTTHLKQTTYTLGLSNNNIGYSDTLITYATNPEELKSAIDALTESGICQKQNSLPVCELRKLISGDGDNSYSLRIDGKLAESFEFKFFGEKALREAKAAGICR